MEFSRKMKSFLQIEADISCLHNTMKKIKYGSLHWIRETSFINMPVAKFGSTVRWALTVLCLVFLQGGFDIPERMFYSVKKEWESASRDNMGDVRELIPEFFYLPDFLLNSNHIQLGEAQISSSVYRNDIQKL